MAFRAASQLKSMVKSSLGGRSTFTTSTSLPDFKARLKGDFAPVSIVIGMIAVSTSLGIYTALHQLHSAPNVHVKKSRRETMPEVAEPEHVAAEAEEFVKKSFFRKVAHLKELNRQQVVPNPIAGDICSRPLRVETLKDVGVETKP
ncbi:uncharacterized protein LOC130987999 [Salvia miltiorrhiza]|uniref:uncharacterized protein LOC130987999 n=1 Tax=Salvia miltiorrhiza TaxID=226208 RepID=UPI0025AC718F|nr:uncharacterized protein LOC130987999 [Salvia miltiorrhiza]